MFRRGGKGLAGTALLGVVDQALLSAFSLAVGLVFIRSAPKAEYAVYVLLTTCLLLAQSVQNALICSPMMTLAPARSDAAHRARLTTTVAGMQGWLLAACAVTIVIAAVVDALRGNERTMLFAALLIAGGGLLAREFARTLYFVERDALKALGSDSLYVGVAALGVGGLIALDRLSATSVLLVIGCAGVLVALVAGVRLRWLDWRPSANGQGDLREVWNCARWALPSVVSSWLYANAFLFIVEALISRDAVADLAAARLLIVPLSLLVIGWANAFRPRASRWFAAGDTSSIERAALVATVAVLLISTAYGFALYLAQDFLEANLLGTNYTGLAWLAAGWLSYYVISGIRNIGMSSMLASAKAFRTLFAYGLVALVIASAGVFLASVRGNVPGVLIALSAAESTLAVVIWFVGWPQLKAMAAGATS